MQSPLRSNKLIISTFGAPLNYGRRWASRAASRKVRWISTLCIVHCALANWQTGKLAKWRRLARANPSLLLLFSLPDHRIHLVEIKAHSNWTHSPTNTVCNGKQLCPSLSLCGRIHSLRPPGSECRTIWQQPFAANYSICRARAARVSACPPELLFAPNCEMRPQLRAAQTLVFLLCPAASSRERGQLLGHIFGWWP